MKRPERFSGGQGVEDPGQDYDDADADGYYDDDSDGYYDTGYYPQGGRR